MAGTTGSGSVQLNAVADRNKAGISIDMVIVSSSTASEVIVLKFTSIAL
jgi:hypothetical protein